VIGWTKEQDAQLLEVAAEEAGLRPGAYYASTARRLGRTPDAVRRRIATLQWTPPILPAPPVTPAAPATPPEPTPEESFKARTVEQALRDENAFLKTELRAAARETNLAARLLADTEAAIPQLPPAAPLWDPDLTATGGKTIETALQFISDLHPFEDVSIERTRGLNEYTPDIAAQRMATLVASHASIVQKFRVGAYEFPELVIALGGDMHPGTIHDLERHSLKGSNAVLHAVGSAWLLAQTIRELSRLYPKTYVFGVPGNHGRLPDARRMQQKDPTRNWDYLIYLMLPVMLGQQSGIEFWFPDSYAAQVEIRGFNFLLNHGHEIKSWGGIPWYGISRYIDRTNAVEAARSNKIDYHLLAHFHEHVAMPHAAGETFVNGSVIGGNDFSLNGLMKMSRPHQLFFGVHEKFGVTHRWPLRLDRVRQDAPSFTMTPWRELQAVAESNPTRTWIIPKTEGA
jgi:hypothetical protein